LNQTAAATSNAGATRQTCDVADMGRRPFRTEMLSKAQQGAVQHRRAVADNYEIVAKRAEGRAAGGR
jgi:hypothetical protein